MKALHITTTGTIKIIEIEKATTLPQMQAAVGGYIEELALTENLTMVLDEEGKLKGRPINNIAHRLAQHFAAGLSPSDLIVGDVLIVGTDHNREKELDIPTDLVDLLQQLGHPLTTKD